MNSEPKDWRPDREADPHVVFGGGHWCPVQRCDDFLTMEGRCPGCGAPVRHPGLAGEEGKAN